MLTVPDMDLITPEETQIVGEAFMLTMHSDTTPQKRISAGENFRRKALTSRVMSNMKEKPTKNFKEVMKHRFVKTHLVTSTNQACADIANYSGQAREPRLSDED